MRKMLGIYLQVWIEVNQWMSPPLMIARVAVVVAAGGLVVGFE